jgi:crossover junction endodeoxyribonuclease RuvC
MFAQPHVVLGIDPGLSRCGYAVLVAERARIRALEMGTITTPRTAPVHDRLATLRGKLGVIFCNYGPHSVAVEQVFFQVNVRTAMSVAQASGVALAEAACQGCEVAQYTPTQVKDAVAGWGGAGKQQVQKMVQARLGLRVAPAADAADAAALALCHLASAPLRRRLQAVPR